MTSPGPSGAATTDAAAERLRRLRHDLSNPLSALLAEVQLLLLAEETMDADVVAGLRQIESLSIRMRALLREE